MKSLFDYTEMPIGFTMALSKDIDAMRTFADAPQEKQTVILDQAKNISSKEEMRSFVHSLSAK